MLRLFSCVLIVLCSASSASANSDFTVPVTISKSQAQANINKAFPIEKKTYWVTATLSNPQLQLNAADQRLGLLVTVDVLLPGMVKGNGSGLLDGELAYRQAEGAFYLMSPKVSQVRIDGLQKGYEATVERLVSAMANELLKDMPIYTLDDTDLRQKIAKHRLRSIEVGEQELIFQMALM